MFIEPAKIISVLVNVGGGIFEEGSKEGYNTLHNAHTHTSVCNPTDERQSIQSVRGVGGFMERYHSNHSHDIIIIIMIMIIIITEIIGNSST
jgi:hypothetical protein